MGVAPVAGVASQQDAIVAIHEANYDVVRVFIQIIFISAPNYFLLLQWRRYIEGKLIQSVALFLHEIFLSHVFFN